jgi:hypothetical protein
MCPLMWRHRHRTLSDNARLRAATAGCGYERVYASGPHGHRGARTTNSQRRHRWKLEPLATTHEAVQLVLRNKVSPSSGSFHYSTPAQSMVDALVGIGGPDARIHSDRIPPASSAIQLRCGDISGRATLQRILLPFSSCPCLPPSVLSYFARRRPSDPCQSGVFARCSCNCTADDLLGT